MKWDELLTTQRLKEVEKEPIEFDDYPINEFERDYNRIVASPVFRRLQDKTQVFPLDKSDFVRTRLTHSIEVSTIARQLGLMISNNQTQYKREEVANHAEEISSVLQCAGLLHDLGNPPFGHFGETTIGEWFKNNLKNYTYKGRTIDTILSDQMKSDLEHFEGNAQALRILLKAKHGAEINISYSIISTLVKYPVNSITFKKEDSDIRKHKLGCYLAEEKLFQEISETVGTRSKRGKISRHPLTFLLEAADDIAYSTADLEDAFKKKLFSLDDLEKHWKEKYKNDEETDTYYVDKYIDDLQNRREKIGNDEKALGEWLNYTRRWMMYCVVFSFSKNYNEIMEGKFKKDLFEGTNVSEVIKMLKDVMKEFVFCDPSILKLELSSQTIISFLLEKFVHAAIYFGCEEEKEKQTKADQKLLAIFSENYKHDYNNQKTEDEQKNLYLRLLMVADYISGMTDTFARTLYRELCGIE